MPEITVSGAILLIYHNVKGIFQRTACVKWGFFCVKRGPLPGICILGTDTAGKMKGGIASLAKKLAVSNPGCYNQFKFCAFAYPSYKAQNTRE